MVFKPLLLVLFAVCVTAELGESSGAKLLVSKHVLEPFLTVGKEFTAEYSIVNIGILYVFSL